MTSVKEKTSDEKKKIAQKLSLPISLILDKLDQTAFTKNTQNVRPEEKMFLVKMDIKDLCQMLTIFNPDVLVPNNPRILPGCSNLRETIVIYFWMKICDWTVVTELIWDTLYPLKIKYLKLYVEY